MQEKNKKKEKKTKGMSKQNLKEHLAFYKWIKHFSACIDEIEGRIKVIEKKLGINKKGE